MLLSCPNCPWSSVCGPAAMLEWLRGARMVRRDTAPEPDLLPELFRSSASKFTCPKCGTQGLNVTDDDAEDDDEAWGMARECEACGGPIPGERLEIFPNATLCAACQGKADHGQMPGPAEYCPRCGTPMTIRPSRTPGVTRYQMVCPQCRR